MDHVLLALGRQDVDPDDILGLGYSALLRAMTSPFVVRSFLD